MSCLQAIEGEDTEDPFICHIMNLLWLLSDKGTRVYFCWIPSHCGIEGNERVDQLAKETLDQDIDPVPSIHYTDLKPQVYSYIQQLVQTKWDVAVHGKDLYLVKPTLGPPKKYQHLTRAEEVVITRLRIGHTMPTKYHILSWGPPTAYHHCGQTLRINHMLLECATLQEWSWVILHSLLIEYSLRDNSRDLHSGIPARSVILLSDMMQFANFNWPQAWTIWASLSGLFKEWKQLWDTFTCVGRLKCPEGRVLLLLNKSNPI